MRHFNLIRAEASEAIRSYSQEKPTKRIGIPFALYLLFFAINALTGLFMQTVTLDGEFIPAACAAAMLGRDWSAVIPMPWGIGEFAAGILYLPAMLLFPDPIIQYRAFMVINAAVYALIAPCCYILACRLGVAAVWQRALIAAACTLAPPIASGSHFICSDSLCMVMIWVLAVIILRDEPKEKKIEAKSVALSAAAGILCAMAYFLCPEMLILPVSVLCCCLYFYFVHKRRPLYFSVFAAVFAVLFAADLLLTVLLSGSIAFSSDGGITALLAEAFSRLCAEPSEFFSLLAGRVYCITVTSWGMSAGALVFIAIAAASFYKKRKNGDRQFYDESFVLCGIFFLTTVLTIISEAFLSLPEQVSGQEHYISDGSGAVVTPFVFLFLVYIFRYGITYVRLMSAISATGAAAFTAILLCKSRIAQLDSFQSVNSPGVAPLKIGFPSDAPFDADTMAYPIFFIFTAFAVLVPVVCCAKKYAHNITAFVCCGLMAFSSAYTYADTIAAYSAKGAETADCVKSISQYIGESLSDGEPPVIAIQGRHTLAMHIQYFNQQRRTIQVMDKRHPPDNCYFITDDAKAPDGLCLLIGRTEGISIYAYGEQAILYYERTLSDG